MKIFLKKVICFALLLFVIMILPEIVIPTKYVTFRSWEATRYNSIFNKGKFYPNQQFIRNEVGDLAHHTTWEIPKKQIEFVTDGIGFRNREFLKNPAIVFLGQSNIAGSGTSQNELLNTQIEKKSGHTTYNIAPSNFQTFVNLISTKTIDAPKVLVYGSIERNIPNFESFAVPSTSLGTKQKIKNTIQQMMPSSLGVMIDKIEKGTVKQFLRARLTGSHGVGVQSELNEELFFLAGKKAFIEDTDEQIEQTAKIIASYNEFCKERGIQFIFFPIPNKETTYFEFVPFPEQPKYLKKLIKVLEKRGVKVINTVTLFNERKNKEWLYHLDDSHWNKNGIRLLTNEVIKLLPPQ